MDKVENRYNFTVKLVGKDSDGQSVEVLIPPGETREVTIVGYADIFALVPNKPSTALTIYADEIVTPGYGEIV